MNALSGYNLVRVRSSEHRFHEVYMIQLIQRLLKSVEEDIAELINIHLNEYLYHGFVVITPNSFAKRN